MQDTEQHALAGQVITLRPPRAAGASISQQHQQGDALADLAGASRVQLRIPLRDVDELEMHLVLIRDRIDASLEIVRKLKRAGRGAEALAVVRYRTRETNALVNAMRHRKAVKGVGAGPQSRDLSTG